MRMERVEETLERIGQEAARAPGGVLAFDGDGTLWSGDVGDDLFLALLEHGDIREPAHTALQALGTAHGLSPDLGARELAHQLFAAFEAGRVPEKEIYEMVAWLFAGWRVDAVRAFARDVVARREVKRRLHPETRRVVEWALGRGIACYVVSASPLAVVEAAVVEVGIEPANVLACTPRVEDGMVLPSIVQPIPYAAGKVACLRARTSQPLYAAFGDNVFDFELLSAACVPVAIRPKPRLRARAAELPSLVQLHPED
ncbi:haloacid dehalogenase-like hydrolase [Pyxidicoccus parkwayensis]|uniref:Haloacid dehalogenase-like hydrolase n=1 Tax=Pyxidicoccus parkwayensis TaxID=2813578 RepID=A0ABX7NRA8_9BACT|nr:haloacid dehalogenase-like hydrolase [Pyxidicoccus parkwaysis]QSQ21404.1 haloacid dehalogenase-like hydrolase [Pyxidicoccus parkwaysis]